MSVLVANEEFPHKELAGRASVPAAIHKQATFDNGVRVVTRERDSAVVSLKFAVLGGSSTEKAAQKGAAHFLSTTAFAGNRNESGLRIVRSLESLGVHFSASADREKIVYDVAVLADKVEPVFASIVRAIASAPHADYVLEEAREVAALAYERYAANHHDQLVELLHETAFGETSPLGASVYNLNLDNLTTESILEYRANHFLRNNLVIAGNGITVDALKSLTDKYVKEIATGTAGSLPASTYTGGDNKVRVDLGGKTNIAVGFHAPVGSAGKSYEVLNNLLSSRLAAKGICASTFHFEHSKNGLIGVHTTGCAQTATKNLNSVAEELKAIAGGAVDATAAKNSVSVGNFSKLEGKDATAYLLNAYLSGEDASKLADNRGVTNEQVSQAAASLLKGVPTYAVLGATAGTPTYSAIQKLFA